MKKVLFFLAALFAFFSLPAQDLFLPATSESDRALKHYQDGLEYMFDADFPNMVTKMEEALEVEPNLFMAHFQLAMNDYFFENELGFEKHLNRALATTGTRNSGENILEEALKRLKADPKADLRDLGQQLAVEYPKNIEAHMTNGIFHAYQEDFDHAVQAVEKANALNPDFASPYNIKGYFLMSAGRMGEARQAFDRYIKLNPDHPNPYDSKGDFFMAAGIYKNAEEMFRKAVEMDKNFRASADKAEVAAAMRVVEYETNSFMKNDYDAWASCYKKGPGTLFTYVAKDELYQYSGWNQISKQIDSWMQEGDTARAGEDISRTNFNWSVNGNNVTLTFDQQIGEGGPTKELRVLERVGDEWKILVMNAFGISTFE